MSKIYTIAKAILAIIPILKEVWGFLSKVINDWKRKRALKKEQKFKENASKVFDKTKTKEERARALREIEENMD